MVKLTMLISCMSNFSAQYNTQSVVVALIVMSKTVCTLEKNADCTLGQQSPWVYSLASAIFLFGCLSGQLSMGYLGEVVGKTKGLLITMTIASWSAMLSGVVPFGSPEAIYSVIIFFRFFFGSRHRWNLSIGRRKVVGRHGRYYH